MLVFFVALSIVVITLDFREQTGGPLDRARDFSLAIVAPIQKGLTTVTRPVSNFFSSIGDLTRLRSDNALLKSRVTDLQTQITEARSIIGENAQLRKEMQLSASYITMHRIFAEVVGRVPSNYKWAVFLDKGIADGIHTDMAVINTDGLVGKIVQTTPHTSTVLLLIDPQAGAGARIQGLGDTGVVQGEGGNENLKLSFIAPNATVNPGDTVVTSGYDRSVFPPQIPIGTVNTVAVTGAQLDKQITVTPFVDFTSLGVVQVLKGSGNHAGKGHTGKNHRAKSNTGGSGTP
ncbi:MAG: rod shape-determining protein MreC [Actinomycetota bacterium]|nr:rod shape-determining protein MreC [Actinomycetota bacterium]